LGDAHLSYFLCSKKFEKRNSEMIEQKKVIQKKKKRLGKVNFKQQTEAFW